MNLLGNAIKHSTGPLRIDISIRKTRENGISYYKVSVEDDGPGMPDELKSTLFDRLNLSNTVPREKASASALSKCLSTIIGAVSGSRTGAPATIRMGRGSS